MALSGLIRGENAGTITTGQRKLANIGSARKVFQLVDPKIINLSDGTAPIYELTEKMGNTKTVGDASYNHFEGDDDPTAVQVDTSTYGTGVTNITLISGHGDRLRVGAVLKAIAAGVELRVTAISGDTITVTRPFAGTTDASIAASAELQIVSFADTDGNTPPRSVTSEPTQKTNYCGIIKSAFELSGRDIDAEVYGPSEVARLMENCKLAMNLLIEKTFLFNNGIASSDPYITGGIPYWVTTNVTAAGGNLTESTFNSWLKTLGRYNQGQKNLILFMGELPLDALDGFARDLLRYTPREEFHGVEVRAYRNAHIDVRFMKHGLLGAAGSGVAAGSNGWQGMAYALNMSNIKTVYFRNRGWRVEPDVQTPGTDGKKWQMMVDVGLWLAKERSHGLLTGVTG